VLCHTAGAEDCNATSTSPNKVAHTRIEFKVMIHRIHDGGNLPSVNGVASDAGPGVRTYGGTAAKNVLVGPDEIVNSVPVPDEHDFSAVTFPVCPSFQTAMPRRAGYSAIPASP